MLELLFLLTTLVLGLFAGSLLTEAAILVPYWRRMSADEFNRLHSTLGPKLFQYFAPLTTAAVVLCALTAMISGLDNIAWTITAVLCLITLAIFFGYFRAANNRFANHDVGQNELADELRRWSNWHWFRTVLILIAFALSIYGHVVNAMA